MIGCIVLSAFLAILAVKFIAHRRGCAAGAGPWGWGRPGWGGHHGHGHHGPWHGFGPGPSGGRWGGRGRWMWAALYRLDLSPAQEKVVRAEIETLTRKAKSLRDEAKQSRADMARAIRGEEFEEDALATMFIRHDDRLHDLRQDLGGALGRIHSVLDPEQRERLADLIDKGSHGWGGPFRSHEV
jgi:uncharacterized membrane protein